MISIRDKVLITEGNAPLEKIKEVEDSQSDISEKQYNEKENDASFLNTEENNFLKQPTKFTDTRTSQKSSYKVRNTLRGRNRVSIINGNPRSEDDLDNFLDPYYRCEPKKISITYNKKDLISELGEEDLEMNKREEHSKKPSNNSRRNAIKLAKGATLELRTFKSWFMTILSIINCIIRYTIVQFPFCMKSLGLIYGPIITCIIGAMSIFSVYMLIKVKEKTGENSYKDFAYKWFGIKGKLLILFLNIISSFGSCLTYIIIFLKFLPNIIEIKSGLSIVSNKNVLSCILAIILLLYLVQNDVSGIKSAAYWGFLGIIFLLFFILTDLLYSSWVEIGFEDNSIDLNYRGDLLDGDSISCIACIILSFSFHTYTFSIYECLTDPNTKSMLITTSIGIFISTMIYLLVGTVGYILYEDTINEYFILYNKTDLSSIAVYENVAFVVNVIMSFPLTFFALRHYWIFFLKISYTLIRNKITGIDTIVHHHQHDHDAHDENNHEHEHDKINHGKKHVNLCLDEKNPETAKGLENDIIEEQDTEHEQRNKRLFSLYKKNCFDDDKKSRDDKQERLLGDRKEIIRDDNFSNDRLLESNEAVAKTPNETSKKSVGFRSNLKKSLAERDSINDPNIREKNHDSSDEEENNNIEDENNPNDEHGYVKINKYLENFLVSIVFFSIILLANRFQELKIIFSYLGATTANIFSFILPSMFYLKFMHRISYFSKIPAILMIVIGVAGLILCVYSNIKESQKDHH